jgi:hypothetical protein
MKWFVLISALFSSLASFGCTPTTPKRASLHGINYQFPSRDIKAAVFPPGSRLFVRLAPAGADFHLILDEWSDLPSYQGPDVPRISRLNDVRFQEFAVTRLPSGPVVCTDRQPHFNCGLRIEDGPVKWSVLFDRKSLDRADEVRRQAEAAIKGYRKA